MDTRSLTTRAPLVRLGRGAAIMAASILFVGVILLTGVGMVSFVAQKAPADAWSRWSNAGQAFGVLTAVFSGFAVAALVITFWMQLQELKAQRLELRQQRELLGHAQSALYNTAQTGFRTLHVDLIKMAIANPDLAAVWPPLQADLSHERNNQYLYANLLIQQNWLMLRSGEYTKAEMRENLRYLFRSPLIREYWQVTAGSRNRILVPATDEYDWNRMADEICREHEIALASADAGSHDSEWNGGWTTAENWGLPCTPSIAR